MGKPAAFIVNFNGAKGRLSALVVSPSGSEEEALVQEVDDGELWGRGRAIVRREGGNKMVGSSGSKSWREQKIFE